MTTHRLELTGCRPEPLMSYLKGLGLFRIVAEQADPEARCAWSSGGFVLESTLDRQDLLVFLLKEYEPTPIVAPWGARSGFYAGSSERSAREALGAIDKASDSRFDALREVLREVRQMLKRLGIDKITDDRIKLRVLRECRNNLPDRVVAWLDTTYVLTEEGRIFPPLLGTGGNEGSGSYVSGFAQQVVECLVRRKQDHALEASLFSMLSKKVSGTQTPGHFSPFAVGGANQGQGLTGATATNPWDYILCLEGACLWSSSASKKLGRHHGRAASFPFTTEPTPVGHGGLSHADRTRPSSAKRDVLEMWLPTWRKFAGINEVRAFLGEGRAQWGRRTARSGVDFSRAIASLGVDRGVEAFHRHCFLMRNGQSFFATYLGRFEVRERREVMLLQELDRWLTSYRRVTASKNAPARFGAALMGIEGAIVEYCRQGGAARFAAILRALGRAERELVTAEKLHERVGPLSGLSPGWVRAAYDGSPELELALALSGVHDAEPGGIGPIRTNLEPVGAGRWPHWAKQGKADVWGGGGLAENLGAVLARRVMDRSRSRSGALPLAARRAAPLRVVSAFLAGDTDDERIEELLWGLVAIDQERPLPPGLRPVELDAPPLPRAYALLKLLFLPEPIALPQGEVAPRPEPAIVALLRAGRVGEACVIAARRLRASGLAPLPHRRAGRARDGEWSEAAVDPRRLAAALLVPISSHDVKLLTSLVLRPPDRDHEAASR